jgi:hypothetical protein
MKHCPQCKETYADESLNYCLNDGTPLAAGPGTEQKTEVLSANSPDRPTVPIIPQQTYQPHNAAYAPLQPQGKSSRAWVWVLGILGVVVLLCGGGFAGLVYLGSQTRTANVASFPTPAKTSPTPLISLEDDDVDTPTPSPSMPGGGPTLAQYEKITIGMSRADVEKIMGGKGSEITSSSGGGIDIAVIQWEGENYKSIIITFQDGKVFTRSQVGLK